MRGRKEATEKGNLVEFQNLRCFLCVCVCVSMVFKFAAQTRLSQLHDEIEKAEQKILRATEEFKQLEEAIQLKKVCKSKATMPRGNERNCMCFPFIAIENHFCISAA